MQSLTLAPILVLALTISLLATTSTAYENGAPIETIRQAMAKFEGLNGVTGWFRFSQRSPNEPTIGEYDLKFLQGNNQQFHVHEKPLPAHADLATIKSNSSAVEALCKATGGHFNPYNIRLRLPPRSAPLDAYELGDLSGKHGSLALAPDGRRDHYAGRFIDDRLPLIGDNTILGRSIVIHKNNGDRWICANIVEERQS